VRPSSDYRMPRFGGPGGFLLRCRRIEKTIASTSAGSLLTGEAIMQAYLVRVHTGILHWWNLTGAVGMSAPNNPDDVQLVQFGFVCMGLPTSTTTDAEIRRLFSQVRPGSPYTATATDILTRAIGALAADRHAGTQDRQVNPFPEGSALPTGTAVAARIPT
jgi:hypothetical protein